VILDQTVVAGVGNIYADEALFLAGIRPSRHADRVTKAEAAKLCEAIRSVMLGSIEAGGTTFRDFLDGAGHEGGNVENLRVYGRDGEPCTVCGTEIQLTKIAGRGTRYCPKCQK
jgi:formamidopyrimidine-DNA glycosylase